MMNKRILSFIGGMAATVVADKVINSKSMHKTLVKTMSSAIMAKNELAKKYENVKEDAMDLVYEANMEANKNCDIEINSEENSEVVDA